MAMTDVTARIKNLSIALEALSRVNQCYYIHDVEKLLKTEIKKAKEENERQKPTPTPTPHTEDDIPF